MQKRRATTALAGRGASTVRNRLGTLRLLALLRSPVLPLLVRRRPGASAGIPCDDDVVHEHGCAGEGCGIGIPRPGAADRDVEQDEEAVVEGRAPRAAANHAGSDGQVWLVVDVPSDLPGIGVP